MECGTWYNLPKERQNISATSKPVAITSKIKDDEHSEGIDAISVEQASKDTISKDQIPEDFTKPMLAVREWSPAMIQI